ncbi:Methyltransferase domain-containing protein [Caballeronia arationis]|uniref:Methyltransferase domain-containing protein n=2 Tax=Caballeronia arationis TaxID=1777142 RepID=A0A7Z7N5F0_9BURK|nr:Methyltransferase domain-containing protein [Caballeronia arationis]
MKTEGYCPCCRRNATFASEFSWLRDHYCCSSCGSLPRNRHIQMALDSRFPGWEAMDLHESSPTYPFFSQYAPRYSYSAYFPDIQPGAKNVDGTRCETIEALTFEDESFDVFITQDVMEHVFHPALALREINRVLRPGGAHVFTAPKHKALLQSVRRAELNADGTINYLMEAQYHGNPQGDGRALVTWDYGYDFERLMSEWCGGATVETLTTVDRARGIDAEFNEVFIIRKSRNA